MKRRTNQKGESKKQDGVLVHTPKEGVKKRAVLHK